MHLYRKTGLPRSIPGCDRERPLHGRPDRQADDTVIREVGEKDNPRQHQTASDGHTTFRCAGDNAVTADAKARIWTARPERKGSFLKNGIREDVQSPSGGRDASGQTRP